MLLQFRRQDIFLCLTILTLLKNRLCLEICKDYALGSLVYSSFYCIDYCCGSCNFRYCCSNDTLAINQEKCVNTIGKPLETKANQIIEPRTAENDSFPAASLPSPTSLASSIKSTTSKLPSLTELCEGFFDYYNYFVQPKRCPSFAKFCCGSCNNRYCCNTSKEKLNQVECKSVPYMATSTSKPASFNNYSNIYVIIILVLVFILAFSCLPFIIFINKRSKSEQQQNNMINNLHHLQTLTPMTLFDSINVSTSSMNSTLPKTSPSTHNGDDSPPAYSTLKFDRNKD